MPPIKRGRPGYREEAIRFLASEQGVGKESTLLDVGAGTGKLIGLLASLGGRVIAVEPVEGMRRILTAAHPDLEIHDATAESLPLDDGEVDAIFCGQSFHWFRTEEAAQEFHRVLKEGSGLALIWNYRDASVPWVKALDAMAEKYRRPPVADSDPPAWLPQLEATGLFAPLSRREFPHGHPLDLSGLVARVRSISYIAALAPEQQRAVVEQVEHLMRTHPDTTGSTQFFMPYVAEVWWTRRR